jgi:hypothetical protein
MRGEYVMTRRPLDEACRLAGVTPEGLAAAGVQVDSLGMVPAAVPHATCMGCGYTGDYSVTGDIA